MSALLALLNGAEVIRFLVFSNGTSLYWQGDGTINLAFCFGSTI